MGFLFSRCLELPEERGWSCVPLGMQGNITGRVGGVFSMGAGIGTAISERRGGGDGLVPLLYTLDFPVAFLSGVISRM